MSSEPNIWFEWNTNGNVTRFQTQSIWGFLLALPLFCGLFGITLFLLFKIYSILFTIVGSELGISSGVQIFMWMAAICCGNVNIPLNRKASICINITGGLIPTLLALYQFSRVEATAIFLVIFIVATISFCSVVVIPGFGIFSRYSILTITALIAALFAIWIATATDRVSVAFAGCVIGHLIGADLLHLRDLQLDKWLMPINIGGAGMDDGIIYCSFYALLFAEYLPKISPFLTNVVGLFR